MGSVREPRRVLRDVPEMCQYSADAGMVCATVETDLDTGETIQPFQLLPVPLPGPVPGPAPSARAETLAALAAEWPEVDAAFVAAKFGCGGHAGSAGSSSGGSSSDVLYVMTDRGGRFVGCVAVDRERFHPFVSHLLVRPDRRGRGVGARLLEFAVAYVAKLGFSEAKLWCEGRLRPFYSAHGWSTEVGDRPTGCSATPDRGRDCWVMTRPTGRRGADPWGDDYKDPWGDDATADPWVTFSP